MSYYFRVAGILSILLAGGFMIVLIGYYAWVVGLVVGLDVFQVIMLFIHRKLFIILGFLP